MFVYYGWELQNHQMWRCGFVWKVKIVQIEGWRKSLENPSHTLNDLFYLFLVLNIVYACVRCFRSTFDTCVSPCVRVCECRPYKCLNTACVRAGSSVNITSSLSCCGGRGPPSTPRSVGTEAHSAGWNKGQPSPAPRPLPQPPLPQPTSQQKGPQGLNSQATI